MTCQQVNPLVERYVDGQLSQELSTSIRAHEGGCARCARRIRSARLLARTLAAEPEPRAPAGFEGRVMDAVYREALRGPALRGPGLGDTALGDAAAGRRTPSRTTLRAVSQGSLAFRRLGFSLVVTALLLALSLLIPRVAYPGLVGPARTEMTEQGSGIVKNTFEGAQRAVQGILREPAEAGSQNGGRLR